MPARKRFTIGMIRILRNLGPLPRRRHIPRQAQPDAIRLEYYKALLPFVHIATNAMEDAKVEILHSLVLERQRQGKYDDFAEIAAKEFVARAKREAERALEQRDLDAVVERFAHRTSEFQKQQFTRQVTAALSVPLSAIETPVVEKLGAFTKENVALIKSVHERYFDRIQADVLEAFSKGTHPSDLAEMFEERDGMAERDARRIARDQIGKLNGQLNEERQQAIGITSYIWRTANDSRVRDEHAEREGKEYAWSDPPEDGNPGEPVCCRCFAEPNFEPILDEL